MAVIASKEAGAVALDPLGKAVAGAVAAVIANTLVYPIDLAKTRLQTQPEEIENHKKLKSTSDVLRKVYAKGGFFALYNGLLGSLAGTVSTNFAYFYWYSFIRSLYITKRSKGKPLSTAVELLLGAVAAAVAQMFTIPVSVITTRQQSTDQSFFECLKEINEEDGIRGLWRGLKASLILVVNPSITYGASSRLQAAFFGDKQHLSLQENFMLGAVSKSMATVCTQPLIVAKAMQQSSKRFTSFLDALAYLAKAGGIRALFKGVKPQLGKGFLVQGLLLAFKDKVESYLILLLLAFNKRHGAKAALRTL